MSLLLALTATGGGYTITCDAGAYALTGQNATILHVAASGYTITADAGSYNLAGQSAEIVFVGGATDTHDGFWKRQWDKIREREKQSVKIEEIDEQIEEIKAAVITVATIEKAQAKPTVIDYSEQTRIIEALIARRAQLIEQEDEELLLLL